ncbi:MAG: coproporphyrinogen III oxidase family protein, partial [Planctomycetota bacterium]
ELYLYPLYVRELTPLGTKGRVPVRRAECYDAAREALKERGWIQRSMRRFSAPGDDAMGTTHRCQIDGMVGVGVGARSYTDRLHYSHDYAVGQKAIRGIIGEYCASDDDDFSVAHHGVWLDEEERRRRLVILSLLDGELDDRMYEERFCRALTADFPELEALPQLGLANWVSAPGAESRQLRLTESGVAASDTIGHWLFSDRTRRGMAGYSVK